MMPERPDPTVNKEAIPAEQPLAASPGPQVEQKPRSGWRSGWTLLLFLLVVVVIIGALRRHGSI